MDKAEFDKLQALCNDSEKSVLDHLYNTKEKKFVIHKADDSKKNLEEWQAAEKALKAKAEELSAKYAPGQSGVPLADRLDAVRFLQTLGYKIAKSKLYADQKAGLIKVNADGTVSEAEARAYAERYLKKVKSSPGEDPAIDAMHKEIKTAELGKMRAQEEKIRWELDREQGKYLLRDVVLVQFCVKWAAIDGAVRHLVQSRSGDWIFAVGGDIKKKDMLVEMIFAELDAVENDLADLEDLAIELPRPAPAAAPDQEEEIENEENI